MKFPCPHCQNPISADASFSGQVAPCPHCGSNFQVPIIEEPPAAAAANHKADDLAPAPAPPNRPRRIALFLGIGLLVAPLTIFSGVAMMPFVDRMDSYFGPGPHHHYGVGAVLLPFLCLYQWVKSGFARSTQPPLVGALLRTLIGMISCIALWYLFYFFFFDWFPSFFKRTRNSDTLTLLIATYLAFMGSWQDAKASGEKTNPAP